ncbi:MAG: glycoside hydrolase family 2, partial [Spirochaetae bacterium HGW-Spirochaetae-8]
MTKFWESPTVQGYGRLPMRSMLLPFPDEAAAQADVLSGPEARNLSEHPWYRGLDGIWRFRLFRSPAEALSSPVWQEPAFDDHRWDTIGVPGTWTRQGYDKPHYTNVQMPFDELPPHTPIENPTAVYRRRFDLPENWTGRRVVLVLGSVESCHILYVNGQEVGGGKDSRLPSEYELTEFLHSGENTLSLLVVRYSDASFVEDQDQWWFGGIHRSVYLYATGLSFIQDIDAQAIISSTDAGPGVQGFGRLSLRVTLGFTSLPQSACGFSLGWSIRRLTQESGSIVDGQVAVDADYHKNAHQTFIDQEIGRVDLWSHEHPSLYILTVALLQGDEVVEARACALGFRSVVVRDRQLLINGTPVLIKGVNRHEHDQHTGKTVSVEAMVRDIKLLKSHHFNAVRTCHYPDDERWYELCDRYGLYLVDEANIEAHAFYDQLCRDSQWAQAFLERGRRMVLRDKNHASVMIWSLGNESGYGANHDLLAAWIRRCDPTRPLHYEGAVRPEWGQGPYTLDTLARGAQVSDIVAPMYPSIELISRYAQEREDCRPLIMCEYSHAMGNSNGSLADYWSTIREHKGLQGGFIWDWMDQGLAAIDENGRPYWKYGGDFGDLPTDYDFCLNGLLFPDQTPKPAMQECAFLFQPVALTYQGRQAGSGDGFVFELHNSYDFSTLDHLRMCWRLLADGTVVAEDSLAPPSVAAGKKVPLVLDLPLVASSAAELVLHVEFLLDTATLWAAVGARIGWAEQVLRPARNPLWHNHLPLWCDNPLRDLGFSHLEPHLFRPPTENDGLKNFLHVTGNPLFTFYYEGKALYPWLEL